MLTTLMASSKNYLSFIGNIFFTSFIEIIANMVSAEIFQSINEQFEAELLFGQVMLTSPR
jgi:hypothetical protein